MNPGQSLTQIREELGKHAQTKLDFIVPAKTIHAVPFHNSIVGIEGLQPDRKFPLDDHANTQMADYTGIPRRYYERLLASSAPLLAVNINHWLNKIDSHRVIRTINNVVVAILSDKYKILDNDRLLDAILPLLEEKHCKVLSSCLTNTRLYIKAATPKVSRIIENSSTPNDEVCAGIVVTNSDVGHGKLSILPFTHRTVCDNGIIKDIVSNGAIRRQHLGRGFEVEDEVYSIEPESIDLPEDRIFWDKVQATVTKALSHELFDRTVANIEIAAKSEIRLKDVNKVVNRIAIKYDLHQAMRDAVQKYMERDQDFTKWGLVNAVTQAANDFDQYELSTFLEKIGGDILTCSNDEWRKIRR